MSLWTNARLLSAAVVIILTAAGTGSAQDWVPFQIAGHLAPAGEWSALYPPPKATSLFDVTPRYRELVPSSSSDLTAFVSSPPAAFASAPFALLPSRPGMVAWRLALAVPLVLALLLMGAAALDPIVRARWSWIVLAATPLSCYAVYTGQPSTWLFIAAVISVLPTTRGRDAAGGLALG